MLPNRVLNGSREWTDKELMATAQLIAGHAVIDERLWDWCRDHAPISYLEMTRRLPLLLMDDVAVIVDPVAVAHDRPEAFWRGLIVAAISTWLDINEKELWDLGFMEE